MPEDDVPHHHCSGTTGPVWGIVSHMDQKAELLGYLRITRSDLLAKLDGWESTIFVVP
jgi:hypothetical protein